MMFSPHENTIHGSADNLITARAGGLRSRSRDFSRQAAEGAKYPI
jgi:hypothetical protein